MAEDEKKTADAQKTEEAKGKSFLDKVTGLLNNTDLQKHIASLVEITGPAGMSQADKEKMVKEFNENDAKRVAAEKVMLDKLKANEDKIKHNDELIAASKAAVQKQEQRIAELDKAIGGLDDAFGGLQNKGADLDKQEADLEKKLGRK
jgi:hypothetical protein